MINFSNDCNGTLKTPWRQKLASRTFGALLLFLFSLLSFSTSFGQAGTACGAHRWDAGDGWRFTNGEWVPTTTNGPQLPQGIVACASAAATESNLQQYKSTFALGNIDFSELGACFNHSGVFFRPTIGEDIIWLNFDIRPLAGTFQFQLENTGGATMAWALYYSNTSSPGAGNPGPSYPAVPGTSGDCSDLKYAACGISFTGWETITVPSFLEATNYYIVMWAQEEAVTVIDKNTIFKARFGCGGATCTLEESEQRITCNANGTYTVCQDYFGSAGSWDIAAPGATSIQVTTFDQNDAVITNTTGVNSFLLGTIPDGAIKATICTTYPIGTNYSVTLTPNGVYQGGSGYVACMSGGSYSGTSPSVPTVVGTANPTTIDLSSGNTSSLTASASGGTGPYTYLWTELTPDAFTSLTNGANGTGTFTVDAYPVPPPLGYDLRVTATDALGCAGFDDVQILIDATLEPCGIYGDPTVCASNTGLVYTYGDPVSMTPYTLNITNFAYKWTITGDGIITSEDDNTGTVTVSATGTGGFTLTMTIDNITGILPDRTCTLSVTAGEVSASAVPTNATCFGGTGSVDLTVSGGTPGYTYLWNTGATTQDLSGVPAGTYSVTVTDANGCTDVAEATVGQPTDLNASAVPTNAACNGSNGSVDLTVSGGTPGYTYLWNTGATTQDLSGVPAGNYNVTVTDANGCVETAIATVVAPSDLTASAVPTNATCNGGTGSVDLTVSGGTPGYTYLWNTGATTQDLSGVPAGNYNVTVTDANGCVETANATVVAPSDLTASAVPTNAACNGGTGSVDLTVSGGTPGYTYLWNTGATTQDLSGVPAGNYNVTVTDANGCVETANATVVAPSDLTASAVPTNATCFGGTGSVDLTVSGGTPGYTYLWNTGATTQDLSGVPAGTYSVTVTDANGCTDVAEATVGQPTDLNASAVPTNAACNGSNGSVDLTVSGGTPGYTYLWNTGATTQDLSGVPAGNYNVTVTDANGCTETAIATVVAPSDLTASAVPTNATCNGGTGSVDLTVSGGTPGYTYLWNTGATTQDLSGVPAGNYNVTVTDANGCVETANATVVAPSDLTASAVPTNAACNGGTGSVDLTVSGGTPGYTYLWNTGATTQDLSGVPAGNYNVTVTDANGCVETANATVVAPSDLTASAVPTNAACNGGTGSVDLTVSGGTPGYTYLWNTGATTQDLSGVPAGNYNVTVTDANGCTEIASATVGEPGAITCSLTAPAASPNCATAGNTVSGTVSGGTAPYTCSASFDAAGTSAGWVVTNCGVAGSAISVTYTSGGTASTVLTVSVTDASGCTTTCTVNLSCSTAVGKACTPGFWKNHPNVWDKQTDFVVNNMPGTLTNPVTKGGTFVTTTNFYTYFDIPVGSCGLPNNASLTMLQATGTGGGNCNALARHGVSALLGAAAFPGEYPYPEGINSFTDLYNAIRNAFLTCNCGPLHLKLAAINELDGEFCGALQKLPQVGTPTLAPTKLGVKEVSAKAYPNPYNTEVNFSLVSPVSGEALLEVYDIVGRKLAVVYKGRLDANISRNVNYQVPAALRETLVYKFTVDGKTVVGKLQPGSKTTIYQP